MVIRAVYLRTLFVFLLFLSSVTQANLCHSLFLSGAGSAPTLESLWHPIEENSQARALIGDPQINHFKRQAIINAKKSIQIQSLRIAEDVVDLLVSKAQQGVRIDIQISDLEKLNTTAEKRRSGRKAIERLEAAGIRVDQYNPAVLQRQTSMPSPDMHKKLLVVDDEVAYVGNKNFNQYEDGTEFGIGLRGEVAKILRSTFYKDLMSSQKDAAFLHETLEAAATSRIKIFNTHELKQNVIQSFRQARKSIILAQMEFNDPDVIQALVEVKKMNPSLDIQIVSSKSAKTYNVGPWSFQRSMNAEVLDRLRQAKIDVYEIDTSDSPSPFFHGKLTVLDGEKIILGSSDYNRRSLEGNAELDIEITAPLLAREFESYLQEKKLGKLRTDFSSAQLRFSKYYHLLTELIVKLNEFKRKTIDKMNISPENFKLMLGRTLGVGQRWINKLGASYTHQKIRDVDVLQKELGVRVVRAQWFGSEKELAADEYLVFIGSTGYYADYSQRLGLKETKNGHFGNGYYFATHYQTALDYSALRNRQSAKGTDDLHVLVYKVKGLRLEGGNSDGFLVEAGAGPLRDYLVLKSLEKVELVGRMQVRKRLF